MKVFLTFAFFYLALFSSAYAYRPVTDEKLAEIIKSFDYTPNVRSVRSGNASCSPQDIEYTTTYPQRDSELQVQAKTFIPTTASGPVPIVFMLPPLGGANQLDLMTGDTFCKNGIAAFLITTNFNGLDGSLPPVTDHDHTHRRVAAAIKAGIIIAKTYPQINTEKIGLFGASLGGILGSVAYSVIPEISAATFIVDGGDVPNILANSDQTVIVNLKNARMKEQGFTTVDQYENYLNDNLEIDPLHFAKMINPNTIKFYLSKADKSVPSVDQMAYYNALGQPKETRFYMIGHVETIVAVLGLGNGKQQIADWFKGRFALSNPRVNPDINESLRFRF
ncbi:MAG: hypothetical protein ACXVAX_03655 [Pseudobdellovibrio sp.]